MHDVVTTRLQLRPVTAGDTAALHALWTDADVRRYLWDDRVVAYEETAAIVAKSARLFAERGFGLWSLRARDARPLRGRDATLLRGSATTPPRARVATLLRAPDATPLLGFGGYWYFRDPPELELLLGLHPAHWGRGLAMEAGAALLRYGFDTLGFSEVTGSTDVANAASVRLMERLGMALAGRRHATGLDTLFYRALPPGAPRRR